MNPSFQTNTKRWSFISENRGHSVRAFISLKMGSLSERAFWKWGSLGESKMWKIKRGSFSDRRFENGSQCDRTYPSHIFRECCPGTFSWLRGSIRVSNLGGQKHENFSKRVPKLVCWICKRVAAFEIRHFFCVAKSDYTLFILCSTS